MKRYLFIMLVLLIILTTVLLCFRALNTSSGEGEGSSDGGTTDGGSTDGGSSDGGTTDGGSTDGGSTDGGSTDGGSTDGGSTDSGSQGGGSTDGGSQGSGSQGDGSTDGGSQGSGSQGGGSTDGSPDDSLEGGDDTEDEESDPIKCEAPKIKWSSEQSKLYWDAVTGAEGYVLTLTNEENQSTAQITLTSCSFTFADNMNGKFIASVHAVGKGNNIDSDESAEKRIWVGWIAVPVK